MPRIDFPSIPNVDEFDLMPDGKYACHLEEVEEDVTKRGDEMWRLRFTVDEGEHSGRLIFDNMVFSPKAMPRAKLICQCLGLDVSQSSDLNPEDLIGRRCVISVITQDYQDNSGQEKQRNQVPWNGYEFAPDAVGGDEGDPPF